MHNPFTIYLAGPIGDVSIEEATSWRVQATERLSKKGIATLDPLRGKHLFLAHAPAGQIEAVAKQHGITPRQIVTRDLQDIDNSDMVIVNLTDVKTRGILVVGSMMEIFYAAHCKGKPAIVIANDLQSPWITFHAIRVVATLDEALDIAEMYFGGRS